MCAEMLSFASFYTIKEQTLFHVKKNQNQVNLSIMESKKNIQVLRFQCSNFQILLQRISLIKFKYPRIIISKFFYHRKLID